MKTLEDVRCESDEALRWSLSANNLLQNHGGYSPNQLVFGYYMSSHKNEKALSPFYDKKYF